MTGTTWNATVLPLPPSSDASFLFGVACPSPVGCVAVGYSSSSHDAPLIETLARGRWSVTPAPALPTGAVGGTLRGVACADPESCVAVGSTYASATSTEAAPWIATLANGTWTAAASPGLGPQGGVLNDVSCSDVTDCVAVGAEDTATTVTTLVETLSGGQWNLTPSPGSGSDHNAAGLTSVACQTAGVCVAVGQLDRPDATHPERHGRAMVGSDGTHARGRRRGHGAVGGVVRLVERLPGGRARSPGPNSPSTYAGAIGDPRGVLIERDAGGTWTTAPGPKGLPATSGLRGGGLRGAGVRRRRHVGPGDRVVALGAHVDHRGTGRVRASGSRCAAPPCATPPCATPRCASVRSTARQPEPDPGRSRAGRRCRRRSTPRRGR